MLEVLTDITTSSGAGKVAVMYFADGSDPAVSTSAVFNFWDDVRVQIDSSVIFDVRTTGREVDEATGTLTGFWSAPGLAAVAGTGTGQSVADATQVLVQWRTGVVLNGREVRGRTFIPGLNAVNLADGNIGEAYRAAIETAAETNLIPLSIGFGVWRRPKEGVPGAHVQATNATVWNELAVLRRRRG